MNMKNINQSQELSRKLIAKLDNEQSKSQRKRTDFKIKRMQLQIKNLNSKIERTIAI